MNRAILELNAADVLPSATLMATAPAFREAVHGAFTQPALGVGCHVVLVDGTPATHAVDVPTLAPHGRFYPTLGAFVRALASRAISPREVENESVAQIRRLQQAGITVTHLDTHKHTHMFPMVLAPLLRAARICGVPAVRNPFEPAWSRRASGTAPTVRRLQVRALALLRRGFLRRVRQADIYTPDGSIGVLATGTLDAEILTRLLLQMPAGTWELVCHPGYADAALQQAGTRLLQSREAERVALLTVLERPAANLPRIDLVHYGELTA